MRSNWKLKPLAPAFFRVALFDKLLKQNAFNIWQKGSSIFSNLLGKKIPVYNGTKFVDLDISKEMVGRAFGSFVLTKRITSDIHSKTHKNKRGRRKKKK